MNTHNYAVICRWIEPDGTKEWDVIHNGPLSYTEALDIAAKARITWDKTVPIERKDLFHTEIPIKFDLLQQMLKEDIK